MDAGWLALALLGLLAGVVSTLFGVGGGIVLVPVLHYFLGVEFRLATSLSLLAIALQAPFGVAQHARRGAVDWRLGAWLAAGGAAGVAAGAWLQARLHVPVLKAAFGLLMLLAAWRLVAKPGPEATAGGAPPPALLGLGAAAGVASRLFGVGGGLVTVPVLRLSGTPIHRAVASSLVPVFTNAALASAAALALGLKWEVAVPLAAGALLGSPAGTWLAHRLHADGLRRVVAGGLGAAAVAVVATSGVV